MGQTWRDAVRDLWLRIADRARRPSLLPPRTGDKDFRARKLDYINQNSVLAALWHSYTLR
jgi:hypothetical protein